MLSRASRTQALKALISALALVDTDRSESCSMTLLLASAHSVSIELTRAHFTWEVSATYLNQDEQLGRYSTIIPPATISRIPSIE